MYALLLYKGHSKERTLDSSYRTISTCPLVAKGLDILVRDLCIEKWNIQQAATQYQGQGSTHELASLLITELIQHSKFASRKPIFLLPPTLKVPSTLHIGPIWEGMWVLGEVASVTFSH